MYFISFCYCSSWQIKIICYEYQMLVSFFRIKMNSSQRLRIIFWRIFASQNNCLIASYASRFIYFVRISSLPKNALFEKRHKARFCLIEQIESLEISVSRVKQIKAPGSGTIKSKAFTSLSLPSEIWINSGILPRILFAIEFSRFYTV